MRASGLNILDDAGIEDQPRRKVDLAQPVNSTLAGPPQMAKQFPLSYDFDIVEVTPDAAQQAHIDALAALGQDSDSLHIEARWRDPRTLAAMQSAGPKAQDILKAAGFGFQLSGSHVDPGKYPAEQGLERHNVIMNLTNMLADNDATHLDWGDFDCMALFKAHAEAEPVRANTTVAQAASPTQDRKRKIAFAVCTIGIVLIGLAVATAV